MIIHYIDFVATKIKDTSITTSKTEQGMEYQTANDSHRQYYCKSYKETGDVIILLYTQHAVHK